MKEHRGFLWGVVAAALMFGCSIPFIHEAHMKACFDEGRRVGGAEQRIVYERTAKDPSYNTLIQSEQQIVDSAKGKCT